MFVRAVALVLFIAAPLWADFFEGKVLSVDAEKGVLVLKEGNAKKEFNVPKDAKFLQSAAKGRGRTTDLKGGLGAIKEGNSVAVFTEEKDGKQIVTRVRLEGPEGEAPAKAPPKKAPPKKNDKK